MTENIRIKPHFSIVAHSADVVELRAGVWNPKSYTLNDESKQGQLLNLLKGLDGQLSSAELAKKYHVSRSEVESLIDHLHQLGALETSATNAFDIYLDEMIPTLRRPEGDERFAFHHSILILGEEDIASLLKVQLLEHLGKNCVAENEDVKKLFGNLNKINPDCFHDGLRFQEIIEQFAICKDKFVILIQQNPNPILCSKWNKIAYELKIPWMHAAMDGPFIFVGPTFHYPSPCYDCFETRMMMNLREYASYQKYKLALAENKIISRQAFKLNEALQHILISHVALETIHYLLSHCNFTKGKLFSIYLPTMELTFNEVFQYSNCVTCGSHSSRDGKQLYFDIHTLLEE